VECAEAADCGNNKACCLDVVASKSKTTCQDAPPCPKTGALAAQICRSDNECKSKECAFFDCKDSTIEACVGTLTGANASACTRAGSGSGSSSGSGGSSHHSTSHHSSSSETSSKGSSSSTV
jgi:hypothetical protein